MFHSMLLISLMWFCLNGAKWSIFSPALCATTSEVSSSLETSAAYILTADLSSAFSYLTDATLLPFTEDTSNASDTVLPYTDENSSATLTSNTPEETSSSYVTDSDKTTLPISEENTLSVDNETDASFAATFSSVSTDGAVLQTTTEWMLNTSSAYDIYWVRTVIDVPMNVNIYSDSFRQTMETRLATCYNQAIQIKAGGGAKRRRRAVTVGNATIQMTNISRYQPNSHPTYTSLVYYLLQNINVNETITPAKQTVALMMLLNIQVVAIILGYPVIIQAETYLPPAPNYLWVIGAVLGGLVGLILFLWCILFIYFKCTRPPSRYTARSKRSDRVPAVVVVVDDQGKASGTDGLDGMEKETPQQAAVVTSGKEVIVGSSSVEKDSSPRSPSSMSDDRKLLNDEKPMSKKKKKKVKENKITVPVTEIEDAPDTLNSSLRSSPINLNYNPSVAESTNHQSDNVNHTPDVTPSAKPRPARHTPLILTPSGRGRAYHIDPWSPYTAEDESDKIFTEHRNSSRLNSASKLEPEFEPKLESLITNIRPDSADVSLPSANDSNASNLIQMTSSKNSGKILPNKYKDKYFRRDPYEFEDSAVIFSTVTKQPYYPSLAQISQQLGAKPPKTPSADGDNERLRRRLVLLKLAEAVEPETHQSSAKELDRYTSLSLNSSQLQPGTADRGILGQTYRGALGAGGYEGAGDHDLDLDSPKLDQPRLQAWAEDTSSSRA